LPDKPALNRLPPARPSISVFSRPVFADDDPVLFGIKVPLRFRKVAALVHDETGPLHATGDVASQAQVVGGRKPTFVFGHFNTSSALCLQSNSSPD
jgi:endonuclease G